MRVARYYKGILKLKDHAFDSLIIEKRAALYSELIDGADMRKVPA